MGTRHAMWLADFSSYGSTNNYSISIGRIAVYPAFVNFKVRKREEDKTIYWIYGKTYYSRIADPSRH